MDNTSPFATMKKLFVSLVFVAVAGLSWAAPQAMPIIYQDATSALWFRCDPDTKTAAVIADQSDYKTDYVLIEDLVIPYSVKVPSASIGMSGTGGETFTEFVVTSVDDDAFFESWAYTLSFAANSQVATIGERAFYNAWFSGEITLPASLLLIKSQAFAIYSGGSDDHITKMVIPASVDSLCLSAIVLDAVEEIEFLGAVPPHCQVLPAADGTAYNPWTQADTDNPATPKGIKITYPDGAYDAYNNCYGIGDYFSCFTGPNPGPVTALRDVDAEQPKAEKLLRNGNLVILRNATAYSVLGQRY